MADKMFHLSAVLSAVTGLALAPSPDHSPMDGICQLLDHMSGEPIFTHQIPRVTVEARAVLLARYPQLTPTIKEAGEVTPENWQTWMQTWIARYGEQLAVPRMIIAQHERIDPHSELAEKMHPSKIVTVRTP